jgi:hypothetical protein
MTGSQGGISNDKTEISKIINDTDEINLIDCFMVLWKYRYYILVCSILPPLLVGAFLSLGPTDYKMTYMYDVNNLGGNDITSWNYDQTHYNMLIDQFYSQQNIDKIIKKLQENKLDNYAFQLNSVKITQDLKRFISFDVLPSYPDLTRVQITSAAQLEEIRQLQALSLNMTITAKSAENIVKISSVIRENFEQVVPTYLIYKQLIIETRDLKAAMADIEANRFNLELELQTNKSVLEKLKKVTVEPSDDSQGRVSLQLNIGNKSEYLPLTYQKQAEESKIIDIEENIKFGEAKYNYYKAMLELNERLYAELKKNVSSFYTIGQFQAFLVDLGEQYENKELKDYISSLIKKVENRISTSAPVNASPKIYSIGKNTLKKTMVVFVAAMIISLLAAFLSEGIRKSRAST